MDQDIIQNVVFGLVYNQDVLSRHTKLFNAMHSNRHLFGCQLSALLDELLKYKTKKRTKLYSMDLARINSFWILPKENTLNVNVRKMVLNWIETKWGNVDTGIMLSLLNDYPEIVPNEFVIKENNEISNKALQAILGNSGDNGDVRLIKTGFDDLDNSFDGGLELGNIVILAGATGTGKTSVAVNMAINMTEYANVAYLMSEQDEASIGRKFIGALGGIKAKIANTQHKIESVASAKMKLDHLIAEKKMIIYNTQHRKKFTIEEINAVVTTLSSSGRKVFFIDNLSYIEPTHNGKRYANFSEFIKHVAIPELNSLCSRTDSLIVVLAQVSNEVAKNKSMTITLNQIMGGQDSVQAAYGVITIHYPYWFINQQTTKDIPAEFMRYSILKALKVRELSTAAKQQYIYSVGDYFRSATESEIIEFANLQREIKNDY